MKKPLLTLAGMMFVASTALAQGSVAPSGGPGGQLQTTPGAAPAPSQFDPTNAPGWSTMNETERSEMRRQMESFKTHDDCRAYMGTHMERMRSRGGQSPAAGGDPCMHLKRG
jgi:hypothetical protein